MNVVMNGGVSGWLETSPEDRQAEDSPVVQGSSENVGPHHRQLIISF